MDILIAITFTLIGAALVIVGQLSVSTGLLGRRNQQPAKQVQAQKTP